MNGYIHSTESFGSVDGPGVRFVIFVSGCPMRCQFCHNPDTWNMQVGEERSTEDLLAQALRYKSYWKDGGGITVSGGEPLMQMDFMIELFRKAKEKGINTTIDTSGAPFTREEPFFGKFNELMKYTDLLLVDIKHIDDEQHKLLTGRTNSNILDMARYLSDIGKPVWIRHVVRACRQAGALPHPCAAWASQHPALRRHRPLIPEGEPEVHPQGRGADRVGLSDGHLPRRHQEQNWGDR